MKKYGEFILLPSLVLLTVSLMAGCNDKNDPQSHASAPKVSIYEVKAAPLAVITELPGRTDAWRIAEVRPQVSGIVLKRNFIEGSDIRAGQSLYQIDPATYQAAYDSARGELAKGKAAARIAHLTVARYQKLLPTQYVSRQDYDTSVANAQQADASVQAAEASVESARINLAYTKVTSPINGRIGKSSVTEGALVTNGQASALATVQQLDPIYVDMTQSSNDFMRLRQSVEQGSLHPGQGKADVELLTENGQPYPLKGSLEFSDVSVDQSTGSITLRARFPNPNHALLPGMFVRARINEGIQPGALLVPQQGITRNPRGDATVLLVDAKNQVEIRNVVTSQAVGDQWQVTSGLQAGEKVIVSGLQRVRPGVAVQIVDATSSSKQQ